MMRFDFDPPRTRHHSRRDIDLSSGAVIFWAGLSMTVIGAVGIYLTWG